VDEMVCCRAARAGEDEHIDSRGQALWFADEGVGDFGFRSRPRVHDLHAEPHGTPRDSLADFPEPDDAHSLAEDTAGWCHPFLPPATSANEAICFDDAARDGVRQSDGEVRGIFGPNVRRVAAR